MTEQHDDRRNFHRIVMHRPVRVEQDGQEYNTQLLDVSLKGALIETDGEWKPVAGSHAKAFISLAEGDEFCVEMEIEISHIEGNHLGVHTTSIDLESASRLRRLVELNLANSDLLERELRHLIIAQI